MSSGKKNQAKPSKNMHKSEREKLKRDCLNELFLELDETLELSQQNNGKATILCNAIKLIQDLVAQVGSLRKENATLLSEERYVTMERNELQKETVDLAAEVRKLQNELNEYNPACGNNSNSAPPVPQSFPINIPVQQATGVAPVCVIPIAHSVQFSQETVQEPSQMHQVSRPQPRYPTGPDSWPHQVFSQQQTCQGEGRGGSPTKVLNLF